MEMLGELQASTEEVTQLLGYVSLNEAAIRKILKKAAKNLEMRSSYGPGLMSMRIEHPHEPGWKLLQVLPSLPAAGAQRVQNISCICCPQLHMGPHPLSVLLIGEPTDACSTLRGKRLTAGAWRRGPCCRRAWAVSCWTCRSTTSS